MREPDRWRRISRGVCWITVGTFLLLTTLGVLRWSYWWSLLAYWPILLVMLGIRLIFARTRAGALVLLSPMVLIATMTLVALWNPVRPVGSSHPLQASRTDGARSWRLEGRLAMAEVDLRARDLPPELLLAGEVTTGRRGRPYLRESGGVEVPRVRLGSLRGLHIGPYPGTFWGELRADLTAELPVSVELQGAAVEGTIDLSEGTLERFELEGAFHDLTLVLPAPNEDTWISVDGAFNHLEIIVPAGTPVRSRTDGLLNLVDRAVGSSGGRPGYRLDVEGFLNRVDVAASGAVIP